jgi:hypothetical protein
MFATMTPIAPLIAGLRPGVSAAPCGVIVVNPLGVAASDWNSPIHHPGGWECPRICVGMSELERHAHEEPQQDRGDRGSRRR